MFRPLFAIALALLLDPSAQNAADPPVVLDAKAAVRPVAPVVPDEVLAAMQAGRYGEAIAGLDRQAVDARLSADDRAFVALLKATALRRSGNLDGARTVLVDAAKAQPNGKWAAKLRGERIAVELAAKAFPAAEALARSAAESALADARKDRLAEVYRGFARRLLTPEVATAAPDPAGAHALLEAARGLAKSKTLRSALLREMAAASARSGNHAAAIAENTQYLAENPDAADRPDARFDLGTSQLGAGQAVEARRTFGDLARDLATAGKAKSALRARALHRVAATYGAPNPPDDAQLGLAIAALRSAIEADPDGETALVAAHEIGLAYLARGKTEEARAALAAFVKKYEAVVDRETEAFRRERAQRVPAAAFALGQVYVMQRKFDDAISAFQAYLTAHGNGPQSADAQRAILDVQLRIAQEHALRERYAQAREVWESFAAKNPLDPRVPGVLFLVGQSFAQQKKFDDAIAAWEALATKFPDTPAAGSARFAIAVVYETEKGDPAAAIEKYKAVSVEPFKAEAAARIAIMERNELEVVTEHVFRSNETPKLKVRSRNLANLTFSAYKLDPEAYFRKKLGLDHVEALDVGLVAPDAEWKAPVPGFAKFKPVDSTYELKLKLPGVYVVKVSDEKNLKATTLVIGSDVEAIVKTSRDQVLVFAQDMVTGKGRPNARVILANDDAILLDARTGPDGVLLRDWEKPLDPGQIVSSLILDGPHAAGSLLDVSPKVAQGLSPRAYIDTDRPAYRPGQTVEVRGVVREVTDGRYDARPGSDYRLEVIDARGRPFLAKPIKLSEFGTFAQSVKLDDTAPVGAYKVRVFKPGGSDFSGAFAVQTYSLRKIDLAFDLPRFVYYRGETIKGSLVAKYQYGTPLAGRPIALALPDGRTLTGETDAAGKFPFELATESFAEDQILAMRAALPRDDVSAVSAVRLAARAFGITLSTTRDVYLDGETFPLNVTTLDAQGKPTGQDLTISILKRVIEAGATAEREVKRLPVKTDAKTGRASAPIDIADGDGGVFVLRASGTDRFGNPVVTDRVLTLSGKKDATKLRILSDRTTFKVGEDAEVRLFNRCKAGPALLSWEADRVLLYKIVPLNEGENAVKWRVDDKQFPNVSLAAARMDGSRFDEARMDATVERSLTVSIEPAKPQVGPSEEVEITVKTTDQNDKPVSAEVSLALVDEALLRLFEDARPPIEQFFHDQTRTGAFTTTATNTFRYDAETAGVSKALVEAGERETAESLNERQRKVVVMERGNVEGQTQLRANGGLGRRSLDHYAAMTPARVEALARSRAININMVSDETVFFGLTSASTTNAPQSNAWFVGTQLGDGSKLPYRPNAGGDSYRSSNAPQNGQGVNRNGMIASGGRARATGKPGLMGLEAPEDSALFEQPAKDAPIAGNIPRERGGQPAPPDDSNGDGEGQGSFKFAARSANSINIPINGSTAAGVEQARMGKMAEADAKGLSYHQLLTPEASREFADLVADLKNVNGAKDPHYRIDRFAVPGPDIGGWIADDKAGANQVGRVVVSRRAFVETAYWNPRIVTGKDGSARVTVKAPVSLSRYRFSAKGVTGSDTLAGQSTAALEVRKPFFVEMTVPPAFTQGDKPKFAARVHHPGLAGKLELKLSLYSGDGETVIPKRVDASPSGVTDVTFEPFTVGGESLRIEVAAKLGEAADSIVSEVPVRPWGVEAIASKSGASRDDTTAIVGLPAGRDYAEPEMTIVVSPSVRNLLVELANDPLGASPFLRCGSLPPSTTADRASDLRGAAAVLTFLRSTRAAGGPDAERLVSRARGLVSELVTQQNEDGGWSWVAGAKEDKPRSDRLATAEVVAALAAVEPLGLVPDPKSLERADNYLATEFAKSESGDTDVRSALLDAMAARRKAGFEPANALNRIRQNLSDSALAHLALTFAALNRPELAAESLDVLNKRAKSEDAGPGLPSRTFWTGSRGPVEATALATLAFARVRPTDVKVQAGAEWLLAHREGSGWSPYRAQGVVLASLSAAFGTAEAADDRYTLAITVNDNDVKTLKVEGASPNATIRVPRRFVKAGGENRVRFDVEGRGRYAFSVTLSGFTREFGPDQATAGKAFAIERRKVSPAEPEYAGRVLPSGFSVAPGAKTFENVATQVPAGGRVRVSLAAKRFTPGDGSTPRRDPLSIEEHIPAGASLVEGSVNTSARSHSLRDGVFTFYFDSDDANPTIGYDVHGVLPGEYRVLPPRVSSIDEPGRYHLGPVGGLTVLDPGTPSADPYNPTPDELYARGKAQFDAGKLEDAAKSLEPLWGGYALRDDVAKDAARMLLHIFLKHYDPRRVVVYFEVLKEKAPELVISFDDVKIVGRAYGDLGEHERAVLVWRAAAEASYLEDVALGEALRQRGKKLESAAYLLDLWRESPDTPAIRADLFGLAQVLATLAGSSASDPATRRELLDAGIAKADLLGQAIRLDQTFLALAPDDPTADEASLALLGFHLDLNDYEAVVPLARRYAALYPKSQYLDSFQYAEALAQFQIGRHDRAIAVAETIASATYKDAEGVEQPSPNKWQALYILGQIHDARREPAKAVAYYERVKDRFTDAADAVKALTRKELSLPEVSGMEPPRVSRINGDEVRSMPPQDPAAKPLAPGITLTYRNIGEVEVKVYPVDLMRLYLDHGDLDEVAGVDLAGITPKHQEKVALGDGKDFAFKTRRIDLPLENDGAYLVIVRGDSLYASGIVLVAPLAIEIVEDPEASRARITVRDPKTGAFVPKATVRVKGSDDAEFSSGETDLRGVYSAEGFDGAITAVVREGTGRYAFYREPRSSRVTVRDEKEKTMAPADASPGLDQNIKSLNDTNRLRQMDRLEQRQKLGNPGGAGMGGFR